MKVTCEEATKICTRAQYDRLSIVETLKLNFHLFMCKSCGTYSKQNKMLTRCINEHLKHKKNRHYTLTVEEKEAMAEDIRKEI